MVDSSSITANSTNVTLHCYFSEYNSDSSGLSLTLMQEKTVLQNMSLAHCNITKPLEDLQSGTNYTLIVNRNFNYEDYTTSCELYRGQFKTKDKDNGNIFHIIIIHNNADYHALHLIVTVSYSLRLLLCFKDNLIVRFTAYPIIM